MILHSLLVLTVTSTSRSFDWSDHVIRVTLSGGPVTEGWSADGNRLHAAPGFSLFVGLQWFHCCNLFKHTICKLYIDTSSTTIKQFEISVTKAHQSIDSFCRLLSLL